MKRTIRIAFGAALAALALASCKKEDSNMASGNVRFTGTIMPTTKSGFDNPSSPGVYPSAWTGKEAVGISAGGAGVVTAKASSGSQTTFSADFSDVAKAGTLYVASPYDGAGKGGVTNVGNGTMSLVIPSSQKSTAKSTDEAAHILAAKYDYADGLPSDVALSFSHVTAYGKITLSGAPEPISKVSVKFPAKVAGKFDYNFTDGSLTETEGSQTITISNPGGASVVWFGCAPAELSGELEVELTGSGTGAVYPVTLELAANTSLVQGHVTEFAIDLAESVKLYLSGDALGSDAPADAKAMTRNDDNSFSWQGDMKKGFFRILFDQENDAPAFGQGEFYNKVAYQRAVVDFEVEYAGTYRIVVYPEHGHIDAVRVFDHVLADTGNVKPINEEFDNIGIIDSEYVEGPNWLNSTIQWIGPFLLNRFSPVVYRNVSIDNTYRLSGKNSLCLDFESTGDGEDGVDPSNGHLVVDGRANQPMAVAGKKYIVTFQLLYEGLEESKVIPIWIEGALGNTVEGSEGARHNFNPTLQNGIPAMITKEIMSDETWGGCVNFAIWPAKTGGDYKLYVDAISIGYDD